MQEHFLAPWHSRQGFLDFFRVVVLPLKVENPYTLATYTKGQEAALIEDHFNRTYRNNFERVVTLRTIGYSLAAGVRHRDYAPFYRPHSGPSGNSDYKDDSGFPAWRGL